MKYEFRENDIYIDFCDLHPGEVFRFAGELYIVVEDILATEYEDQIFNAVDLKRGELESFCDTARVMPCKLNGFFEPGLEE